MVAFVRHRLWRRTRARHGDALGDAGPRLSGPLRGDGAGGADGDAGARAGAQGVDALRRPVRAVDRRRLRIVTKQRDWFYFVDGIEGDRSAAEVTLHPGDVEWWDYRSWTGSLDERPSRRRRVPEAVCRNDERRRRSASPGAS